MSPLRFLLSVCVVSVVHVPHILEYMGSCVFASFEGIVIRILFLISFLGCLLQVYSTIDMYMLILCPKMFVLNFIICFSFYLTSVSL